MFHKNTSIALAVSLALSGCMLGPDFKRPLAPKLTNYGQSNANAPASALAQGGSSPSLLPGKDIPGLWWGLFRSPKLNALIQQGLRHSPDLQAAQAALAATQESAFAQKGALLPTLDASFSDNRQKTSGALFGNPGYSGSLFTLYNASVQVSYTLDFFGAIRRQIESLNAQAEYQRFLLEGAFLSLVGNIVTTAIQEASLREQIAATEAMIASQTRQLELIKQQAQLGSAARSAVLAQQAALAQSQTQLPPLQQQLAKSRHQLSLLVGDLPHQAPAAQFTLADLQAPEQLPISLPSQLVEHRPDIRAQESMLHASTAQIGVLTASVFPNFALTASSSTIATDATNMFVPSSYIWSAGGKVLQPIFHGGQFTHARSSAIATYEQVAAQYKSTVLKAFHDVADTLSALDHDAAELEAQSHAKQTARESLSLLQAQYGVGAASYLQVLDAERLYQQSQLGHIKAQAARLADSAALLQALGGGWWHRADLSKTIRAPKTPEKTTLQQDIGCFIHACIDQGNSIDTPATQQENNK